MWSNFIDVGINWFNISFKCVYRLCACVDITCVIDRWWLTPSPRAPATAGWATAAPMTSLAASFEILAIYCAIRATVPSDPVSDDRFLNCNGRPAVPLLLFMRLRSRIILRFSADDSIELSESELSQKMRQVNNTSRRPINRSAAIFKSPAQQLASSHAVGVRGKWNNVQWYIGSRSRLYINLRLWQLCQNDSKLRWWVMHVGRYTQML